MKKVFALLISAVMLFSFTGCLATPEPEVPTTPVTEPSELPVSGVFYSFKYDEYSDHVVLTQYTGKDVNVYVPGTINGKPVTDIGMVFKGNMNLISVTISENVTAIADEAFRDCYNLQRIEIKSGVQSIGSLAFYGCQALKLAYIPASVISVEPDAFKYCTDLLIYGDAGSVISQFADHFNSIYFRDIAEVIGTTEAEETTVEGETTSAEGTTATEEITTEPITTQTAV